MQRSQLWELVRRLAHAAGIEQAAQLSIHSLRDTQDFARYKDARTTRRYGRSRDDLDCSPTYTLAAYLA